MKKRMFKKIKIASLGAFIFLVLSFLGKLVPCLKITKDSTSFGLCKLPGIFQDIPDLSNQFYGISNNPITGFILQFVIAFAVIFMILNLSKKGKKSKEVVDLTKSK
jgi:hypothetical protein